MRLRSRIDKLEKKTGESRGVITVVVGHRVGGEFVPTGEEILYKTDGPDMTILLTSFANAAKGATNWDKKRTNPQ